MFEGATLWDFAPASLGFIYIFLGSLTLLCEDKNSSGRKVFSITLTVCIFFTMMGIAIPASYYQTHEQITICDTYIESGSMYIVTEEYGIGYLGEANCKITPGKYDVVLTKSDILPSRIVRISELSCK